MKTALSLMLAVTLGLLAGCASKQAPNVSANSDAPNPIEQAAVAACATCVFGMEGVTGCKLAVEIDGERYLVRGSAIDDHGDAHAPTGLCNTSRAALIQGKMEDGAFVATRFELKP